MEIPVLLSKLDRLHSILRMQRMFLVAELQSDLNFITFMEENKDILLSKSNRRFNRDISVADKSRNPSANARSNMALDESNVSLRDISNQRKLFSSKRQAERVQSDSVKSLTHSRKVLSAHRGMDGISSANDSRLVISPEGNQPNESFHSQKQMVAGSSSMEDRKVKPRLDVNSDIRDLISQSRTAKGSYLQSQFSPAGGSVYKTFSTPKTGEDSLNKKQGQLVGKSETKETDLFVPQSDLVQRGTFGPTEYLSTQMLLIGNRIYSDSNNPQDKTQADEDRVGKPDGVNQNKEKGILNSAAKTRSGLRQRGSISIGTEKKPSESKDQKQQQASWKQKLGMSIDKSNEPLRYSDTTANKSYAQLVVGRKTQPVQSQHMRLTMSVENNLSDLAQQKGKRTTRPEIVTSYTTSEIRSGKKNIMSFVPDKPDNTLMSPSAKQKLQGVNSVPPQTREIVGGMTNIYVKRLKINMNETARATANPRVDGMKSSFQEEVHNQKAAKQGPNRNQQGLINIESVAAQSTASGLTKFKTALIDVLGGSMRKGSVQKSPNPPQSST
jgi:hypothetical protein